MRTIKTETKVYKFSELSESSQQNAIEKLWDINVDYEWWAYICEDAKTIGCKIVSFDIDRGSNCEMLLDYEDSVIGLILKHHGPTCETYKIAKEYQSKILDSDGNIDSEIASEFKHDLQEEYLNILRREYEYLTSEECIKETIEANDYEFTEDGKIY